MTLRVMIIAKIERPVIKAGFPGGGVGINKDGFCERWVFVGGLGIDSGEYPLKNNSGEG